MHRAFVALCALGLTVSAGHAGRVAPPRAAHVDSFDLVVAASPRPSAMPRLRIITTNDFHGALEPRPDARGVMRGGTSEMAAEIEPAARSCPHPCETLLLDGGDEFQGTPASNLEWIPNDTLVDYIQTLAQPVAPPAGARFTVVHP